MPPSRLSLLAQSLFYVAAGVNHFWHEDFYRRIMPDHYSHPGDWVLLTGAAETLGGLGLLIPQTRLPAAFGIALMLAGYFDVHIFMLRHADRFPEIPRWVLEARIPLQLALIGWTLHYARSRPQLDRPPEHSHRPAGHRSPQITDLRVPRSANCPFVILRCAPSPRHLRKRAPS